MVATEEQLIDQIKAGDRDAFRHFVSLYRNKAYGLCYSIVGNTEDAKDILQTAFIKAYKNINTFKRGSTFYTWFYRIVVNTARDLQRKNMRRKTVDLKEVADFRHSSDSEALTGELRERLDASIRELSEKQRLCFVMKHVSGIKIDEIAQTLQCSPSTVKIHLFRAVRNLRKKLTPYLGSL